MVVKVIKRNGTNEDYDFNKIVSAINKSADRVNYSFTKKDLKRIKTILSMEIEDKKEVSIDFIHGLVEKTLYYINKEVAESYSNYRNYKNQFGLSLLNSIESQVEKALNDVDRSNSNSNSRLISTKRTDIAKIFAKELYQKIHLNVEEVQAMKEGYIYLNDGSDLLLPQINCTLFDMKSVLKSGFEIENIFINEPKNIRTAMGVMGDVTLSASSQIFGGFTIPEVDKTLAPYYKMSIDLYEKELLSFYEELLELKIEGSNNKDKLISRIKNKAREKAYDDLKQELQGFEAKVNTTNSARGAFAFITYSFGDVENEYEEDVCKAILEVRMEGHGKIGRKKKLIFPKLVFIHNEEKHSEGCKYENIFNLALKCSSENMYPDYIGKGHRREGKVVSQMGKHNIAQSI